MTAHVAKTDDPTAPDALVDILPPPDRLALYLDVDGTLLGVSERERGEGINDARRDLIVRLLRGLDGACAMLTGRSLQQLDAVFAPLVLTAAGLQGLDRRRPDGARSTIDMPGEAYDALVALADGLAQRFGHLVVEKKPAGVTLVYDQNAAFVDDLYDQVIDALPDGVIAFRGIIAIDMVPDGAGKNHALEDFQGLAPFAGRVPVHIGDDVADELAFRSAIDLGGFGIAVRRPSRLSAHRLEGVDAVWRGLDAYVAAHGL